MAKKTFTVQNIIDAAEKNGYEWRGNENPLRFVKYDSLAHQQNFCVLEQAAKNLGLEAWQWTDLSEAINTLDDEERGDRIWDYNDDKARSYKDAAGYLKRILKKYADKVIEIG